MCTVWRIFAFIALLLSTDGDATVIDNDSITTRRYSKPPLYRIQPSEKGRLCEVQVKCDSHHFRHIRVDVYRRPSSLRGGGVDPLKDDIWKEIAADEERQAQRARKCDYTRFYSQQ